MAAIDRVIVGVNGSPRNLPALRYAAALNLANSHFTSLFLVLAWVPPGGEYADLGYSSPWLRQEWEKAARERLREAINVAFGGLPTEVFAEPVTIRGPAGPVLVQTASRASDVLVIGAGRRGTAGRMAAGYTSRYCLARATCPVLAVPPASLELQAGHGLHRWAFRRRGLSLSELTAGR